MSKDVPSHLRERGPTCPLVPPIQRSASILIFSRRTGITIAISLHSPICLGHVFCILGYAGGALVQAITTYAQIRMASISGSGSILKTASIFQIWGKLGGTMLGGPVRGLQYVGVPSCMRMGPSRRCFRYVFRESDRGICPQELLSIRDPLHWTQGSLLYFSIVPNIVPNKDH